MAKQEIKFKITLKELSVEFEGSRDVVRRSNPR